MRARVVLLALLLTLSVGSAWAWWPVVVGGRVVAGDLIRKTGAVIPRAATAVVEGRVVSVPWVNSLVTGVAGSIAAMMVLDGDGGTGHVLPGTPGTPGLCPPGFSVPGWADCNTPPPTAEPVLSPAYFWHPHGYTEFPYSDPTAACLRSVQTSGYVNFGSLTGVESCYSPGGYPEATCDIWQCEAVTKTGGYHPNLYAHKSVCPSGQFFSDGACRPPACPSGYAYNGTTCTLTDDPPVQWPDNDIVTMVPGPTPTGWMPHPREGDTSLTIPSGTTWQHTGVDDNGAPVSETWTATGDGGLEFEQRVQTQAADGTSQVTTQGFVTNNAGDVINSWYFNEQNSSLNITNNTTHSNTQTVQAEIDLPSDYAREQTLAGILEELQKPAEPPPEDPADFNPGTGPEIPETNIELPAISADGPSLGGSCPPALDFTAFGIQTFVPLTPFCDLATKVAPLIVAAAWLGAAAIAVGGIK